MALQGSQQLSHLDKRNNTFIGIEAGLAVLRADLNNALTFNGRNASPQEGGEKTTLEIKLERFVVNPANGQMILARIGWHLGSGGVKREISTLDDRSWSAHQFSTMPISSSFTYLGADLWKLDLTLTEELLEKLSPPFFPLIPMRRAETMKLKRAIRIIFRIPWLKRRRATALILPGLLVLLIALSTQFGLQQRSIEAQIDLYKSLQRQTRFMALIDSYKEAALKIDPLAPQIEDTAATQSLRVRLTGAYTIFRMRLIGMELLRWQLWTRINMKLFAVLL